jgi:hypothetical protein
VLLFLDSWINRWYKLGTQRAKYWTLWNPRKWFHLYWRGSHLLGTVVVDFSVRIKTMHAISSWETP